VVVDKQLRHIAILDANRDCVYLLTTIMVMHHIIEFKTNFEQDHHFAMNTTLKPHRTIKNSKSAAMLSIMFGKIQEREVLAISYYNGLIEIY
jgi:predicted small integral membrane protein